MATDTASKTGGGARRWLRGAGELAVLLLVIAAGKTAIAEPFYVPSGSMEPTLQIGDELVATKFSYGYSAASLPFGLTVPESGRVLGRMPERGDVVVFRWPGDPSQTWVKRVIGLPGDRIETRGSELYINGERVGADEIGPFKGSMNRPEDRLLMTYGSKLYTEHLGSINHTIALTPAFNMPQDIPNASVPSEVPKGCYIVMGDNRMNSTDSRWWGCMPEQNLVGKAFFVWLAWRGPGNGWLDFSKMGKVIH